MIAPSPQCQPSIDKPGSGLKNGEFYTDGDRVFKAPTWTRNEANNGNNVSMGFHVCTVTDWCDAANVVECLNASREVDGLKSRLEQAERALRFYADGKRYGGPNQRKIADDPWTKDDAAYLKDVTRDGGAIARAALEAKPAGEGK